MVNQILSQDLALRHNARVLFDRIESVQDDTVILDFKSVKTMTRSFAHEYLSKKSKSSKLIKEVNVSPNIRRMFNVVDNPPDKHKLVESRTVAKFHMD